MIEIKERPMEDNKKKAKKEQEKEQAKEKEKGKATVVEKRQGTTELGSLSRKTTRATKPIYQAVLLDDDVNIIVERVYDSMTEPIKTFTTVQ